MKKIKIKIKPDGRTEYVEIDNRRITGARARKPTSNIVDEIIVTDKNPTCVWRRGRRYCR